MSALVAAAAEHNTQAPGLTGLLHQHAPRSPQVQARLAEVRRLVVEELLAQLRWPHR